MKLMPFFWIAMEEDLMISHKDIYCLHLWLCHRWSSSLVDLRHTCPPQKESFGGKFWLEEVDALLKLQWISLTLSTLVVEKLQWLELPEEEDSFLQGDFHLTNQQPYIQVWVLSPQINHQYHHKSITDAVGLLLGLFEGKRERDGAELFKADIRCYLPPPFLLSGFS